MLPIIAILLTAAPAPHTLRHSKPNVFRTSPQVGMTHMRHGVPKKSNAALKLLSPPGAGYDVINGDLYTASGGAVTFTAATPRQYCPDSSGALRSLAANKPCVVDGLSFKDRSAVTNNLLQSEALDNASWTDANTAPTVTANSWDFGVGSATGETLNDVQAASSSGRQQAVATTTATSYTFACYAQSGTLTGMRFNVVVTGGTGTAACTFSDLSSTTQRKTCTVTAGAGVTSVTPQVLVGTVASDTGTIKVGGCQLVQSSVPGDYCPTTTGAVTCTAETATVATPAALSRTEGCLCATINPTWTGNAPGNSSFVDPFTGSAASLLSSASGFNTIFLGDGTITATVNANFTSGTRKRFCSRWSAAAGTLVIQNVTDGLSATAAGTFTTMPAIDATIGIGGLSTGANQGNALIDSIVFGRSPLACN